jgi:rhamnosyltransferase
VSELRPGWQNCVAVIVTHHPGEAFPERLRELAAQFREVVIIDNHSGPDELTSLRTLAANQTNLLLIPNRENLGVAAALNQGCRAAAQSGAVWVATFDQDSTPGADFMSRVAAEWALEPERDGIGLVGVNFRLASGTCLVREGAGLADARAVITSGSLLRLDAWKDAGPFREDFFIDEVDHEFALRLRRRGWRVKVTRRVLMRHTVGSPQGHHLGAWRPVLSHHSALRRYYMVRNRILLARAHLGFDPRFVCCQLGRSVREGATVLLFEPQKAAKLRAMAEGLLDGLRGRSGRAARHAP